MGVSPRAPALPPDERRRQIIDAATPLLLRDPLSFTTRAAAEAAGIAEGTLFRHFGTKAELIMAVTEDILDPTEGAAAIRAASNPTLEGRVAEILEILRAGIAEATRLFAAVTAAGVEVGHPGHHDEHRQRMTVLEGAIVDALTPFDASFRLSLPVVAFQLRSLSFLVSHPMGMPEHSTLTPDQIVHAFLYGVARPEES